MKFSIFLTVFTLLSSATAILAAQTMAIAVVYSTTLGIILFSLLEGAFIICTPLVFLAVMATYFPNLTGRTPSK